MYAAKAHTGQAVLSALLEADADIECAAAGELQRAIQAGADPDTLQYTAVNPPDRDLDYAVDLAAEHPGLTITAGARDTFDRLEAQGLRRPRRHPDQPRHRHGPPREGCDGEGREVRDSVRGGSRRGGRRRPRALRPGGHPRPRRQRRPLHDDLDDHCRAIAKVAEMGREVSAAGDGLEFVDFGGGFGVPYREDEEPLDMEVVGEKVRDAVGDLDAQIKLEPGRYVVADAELILTTVNTVKETPAATVVGVDASLPRR